MNEDQSIVAAGSATKRGEKLDAAQKAKLQKAVREFESIFVGYMLKSMRNTVEKADNSTESFGGDVLEGMFDVELAKHISANSRLGMAEMLYKRLTGENLPPRHAVQSAGTPGKSTADGSTRSGELSLEGRLKHLDAFITEASAKFGVSDSLIKAVIATESAGRTNALSAKNAKGVMQLMDATADEMGVRDVWDPRENILGGTKYLKQLLETFDGDEALAVASYNAGPNAVMKHKGVPPYNETKEYVARVMNFLKLFNQQEVSDE